MNIWLTYILAVLGYSAVFAILVAPIAYFINRSEKKRFNKEHGPKLNFADVPWPENECMVRPSGYIIKDGFPVTNGHALFIPKYNSPLFIEIALASANAAGTQAVENGTVDGFNVGMNNGTAAGQTVMWPHVHLILRHKGDVDDPVGGVRNTIPGQGNYHKETYTKPTEH